MVCCELFGWNVWFLKHLIWKTWWECRGTQVWCSPSLCFSSVLSLSASLLHVPLQHTLLHSAPSLSRLSNCSACISCSEFQVEELLFVRSLRLASRKRCNFEKAETLRFEIAMARTFISEGLGTVDLSLLFHRQKLNSTATWHLRFRNVSICDFIQRFFCGTCGP